MTQNESTEHAEHAEHVGDKESSQNRPIKKFRAGAIVATVWNNKAKEGDGEYQTVSFERSYKDHEGVWQRTTSLRMNDLPKAALVLQKAYEYITLATELEA